MSIPHVFSPIKPNDFTLRTTKVHKPFVIQRSDLYSGSMPQTSSGYRIWEANYLGEHLKLGSTTNYPTNSFDGTYKQIIWKSIDTQFYRFPYDKTATLEHANKRFTYKFLNYSASILSLPYLDFGESIKPGSVQITGSGINLTDDRNGNLYDVSLSTGSYSDRHNLVAYWGFNSEFRKTKNFPHTVEKTRFDYESGIFTPDESSIANNIILSEGVSLNSTASSTGIRFEHYSYILTSNRNEFNFTKDDDFTISFWVKYISHGAISTLICKDSIISKQVYDQLNKPNQNDQIIPTFHVSTSTEYSPTPIYPYRFEITDESGSIQFKRSDGTNICHLSGSTNLENGAWHHIAAVKSGSQIYLYQDGSVVMSGSDVAYNPHNNHSLMFGADNFADLNGCSGTFLDEIRIYNRGLSPDTIATLADNSTMGMYQTSIVGNVFYRSGNVIISSLNPKYNKLFNNDFTLKYEGTHTIYTYEAIVRIKAGSYNLTLNPTALKSPYSDLLIDDFTSSFSESSLTPYATSIGLYNDAAELLAVAKLNQPLRMRSDVTINILVQIDC